MIFSNEHIYLNKQFETQAEALKFIAQAMEDHNLVVGNYLPYIIEREELASTYIGNGVAIPHGTEKGQRLINQTGLIFVQVPFGVKFESNNVQILIGIASKTEEHMEILSKIAVVLSEDENVERIVNAKSSDEILQIMNGETV